MRAEFTSKKMRFIARVQRVPETEKMGRLHSSTAIVVVMPEVPREFKIDEKDIKIDTFRA